MPIYRLFAGADGVSHLEALGPEAFAFENGPGPMKGVGGTVLGRGSWVALMRFDEGARSDLHRVGPGLAVLLEGQLVVAVADGAEVLLAPGDAVRIEAAGRGWAPANPGPGQALLALARMSPGPGDEGQSASSQSAEPSERSDTSPL